MNMKIQTHKHGKKHINMVKSTSTKIRHILAQEGKANNIKAIKHDIKGKL